MLTTRNDCALPYLYLLRFNEYLLFVSCALDTDMYVPGVGAGNGEYKSDYGEISTSEHLHKL